MAAADTPRFGFRLVSAGGDTLGTVESVVPPWQTGDTVIFDGTCYRVKTVIPIELIAEFVDTPLHGVLEVEPI